MARFIKGDFPFSDLSCSKRIPAVVINPLPGSDIILCQITSKVTKDKYAIEFKTSDFDKGSLPVESYVRPNKIFFALVGVPNQRLCRCSSPANTAQRRAVGEQHGQPQKRFLMLNIESSTCTQ